MVLDKHLNLFVKQASRGTTPREIETSAETIRAPSPPTVDDVTTAKSKERVERLSATMAMFADLDERGAVRPLVVSEAG